MKWKRGEVRPSSRRYYRGREKLPESRRCGYIGRFVIIDIRDDETALFDEVMEVVDRYIGSARYEARMEAVLHFPGLDIYPERRKIYREEKEVRLTAKEFDILCLLAANRGKVMTYGQIYEQVWGDYVQQHPQKPPGKRADAGKACRGGRLIPQNGAETGGRTDRISDGDVHQGLAGSEYPFCKPCGHTGGG